MSLNYCQYQWILTNVTTFHICQNPGVMLEVAIRSLLQRSIILIIDLYWFVLATLIRYLLVLLFTVVVLHTARFICTAVCDVTVFLYAHLFLPHLPLASVR